MPQRLTPAGAAAIVDSKVKAREEAAQAERATAAQRAAEERAWQAQFKKMLAAACEGNSVLVTKTRPIRIADLRKLGFKVWKEVDAENLSDLDALRVKLEAAVKKQDAAIAKMEAAVSKWVHCLIERPMKRDLEREMTRLLRAYGFESVSDLFDDEAFELLYHPQVGEIISSAIESGEIRDWLGYEQHVKSIDATLAQVRRCQSERENIQAKLQPIQSDLLRVDQELRKVCKTPRHPHW